MRALRLLLPACLLLAGLLAAAAPALAQSAPDDPEAEAPTEGTFAGEFFMTTRTDPRTKEKSIELIGSLMIWFLLALSVVSVGLIGTTALANQRKAIAPPALVSEARRLVAAGRFRELMELATRNESHFSQVLRAALQEASHGYPAMIRSLEQASEELTTARLRRVEHLNVLGQVSPMIGLFGTVYGMIMAFHTIVAAGGNADPAMLAGGISTALVTTFWGLLVAIPALTAYALVRNKVEQLAAEAALAAQDLVNQFRPRPARRPASEAPAPAASGTTQA